ncbi:MAG TPA: chemotaxis protein CheC, partial [Oscillospiraceae bacterium]|nr:chemotaxis protein CheC [Oscillospiraceae bacterium]
MSIHQYDDLNSMHFDVLRELGNIGSGNAATA